MTRPDFKNSIRIVIYEMFFYYLQKGVHESYHKYYSLFQKIHAHVHRLRNYFLFKIKCGLVNDISMKHLGQSDRHMEESIAEWFRLNQRLNEKFKCTNPDNYSQHHTPI